MTHRTPRLAAIVLLMGIALPASAQNDDQPLLEQVIAAYRDTDRYQATARFAIAEQSGRMRTTTETDVYTALDRNNNRLMVDRPEMRVVVKDSRLLLSSAQFPGRHLDTEAPDPLSYLQLVRAVPFLVSAPAIDVAFLIGEDPIAVISQGISDTAEALPPDPDDPQQRPRLRCDVYRGVLTLSIDPESKLIQRAAFEMDVSSQTGQESNNSLTIAFDFDITAHNEAPAENAFAFDVEATPAMADLQTFAQWIPPMEDGGDNPMVGNPAPMFTLPTLDGGEINLAQIDARVIVLDFWAIWCGPCHLLLPQVQRVADWAEQQDLPVAVLTVNGGEPKQEVADFWKEMKLTMPVLMDEQLRVNEAYGAINLPHSVIILDGKIAKVHSGLRLDIDYTALLQSEIEELLLEGRPDPDADAEEPEGEGESGD